MTAEQALYDGQNEEYDDLAEWLGALDLLDLRIGEVETDVVNHHLEQYSLIEASDLRAYGHTCDWTCSL